MSKDKKTKNKLEIEWPKSHFTIQDIQNKYPDAKNITLRFRINKAKEEGDLVEIGKNDTKVGRPTIVFAPTPITSEILESAVSKGILLYEEFESKVVDVATVGDNNEDVRETTPQKSSVVTV